MEFYSSPMQTTKPAKPVVLITGAGGGLGQGFVREFAAQGWRVAAAYHLTNPHTGTDQVWPVQLDVTNRAQVGEVLRQALNRWGRIDVLVNNAGVIADHLLWQLTEADWDRVLAVNLRGAFFCSQTVARIMAEQGGGQIISIASFSARSGQRGQANYAAAKAGLIGLTESLAKELGPRNVRANAILPGVLPTPMTAHLGEATMAQFAASNALGRINSVTEAARFVVFLATMENVSGQVFQLDSRMGRWT
jgi:NAD(P)-dependent dehydrogenase (short-subunit alcohol dehydrogenase family)